MERRGYDIEILTDLSDPRGIEKSGENYLS